MEGLPDSIDPTSREDAQQRMDAYFKEYKGMMDRGAVKAVKPQPGAKFIGTTTRLGYKSDNSVCSKRKCRMYVRDQQVEGEDFFQQFYMHQP